MQFTGTDRYVAPPDLAIAVNAAVTLERPLLVKGEPGTGKTELARQVAASLGNLRHFMRLRSSQTQHSSA